MVCGLESVQALLESGVKLECPIEVIIFIEEEGTTFRCPLAGSKALTGMFQIEDIKALKNETGMSLYDTAKAYGLDPDNLDPDCLRQDECKAMLELHIEQGAVLVAEGLPVGIVERIAGSENHRINLSGRANHAGTTPMNLRQDALACAAEIILSVERIASERDRPHTTTTVGRMLKLLLFRHRQDSLKAA